MQTFTHFLITAFAQRQAQQRGWLTRQVHTSALLVGAAALREEWRERVLAIHDQERAAVRALRQEL
jgi:hypothetical protein